MKRFDGLPPFRADFRRKSIKSSISINSAINAIFMRNPPLTPQVKGTAAETIGKKTTEYTE
jgi:hypothetical protein